MIDFKRDKTGIRGGGRGHRIRSQPQRAHRAAALRRRREALHPAAGRVSKLGRKVMSGPDADILVGNALPLKNIPAGTVVHNIELKPGKGGQMARSAGAQAQLVSKEGGMRAAEAAVGRNPQVLVECMATIGQVGNVEHENVSPGQGGAQALDGQDAAQPRRVDEPGGSPARRRRGQDQSAAAIR